MDNFTLSDTKYVRHKKGGQDAIYQLSDTDMAGATRYYLYIGNEGGWLIVSEEESAGITAYRYKVGWSDITAAWEARAGGGYVRWDQLGEQI